ncbi:hypothetical protein [Paenibacillus sp. 1P03SA]|uniref:hypothetical protein n=1 Tax=Paenibacillus sp. 1P03SA TaxID=3132294 RepID=UPI0039A0542C
MKHAPKKEHDLCRLAGYIFLLHGLILCLYGLFSREPELWNPFVWWGTLMLLFGLPFQFWSGFERQVEDETL